MWNVLEFFLDLIYPRRCPVCHEIVDQRGKLICDRCRKDVEYIKEPFCKKCGKGIIVEEAEYCLDCTRKPHFFERGFGCFHYRKKMKESMYYFKYRGRKEYANYYVEELQEIILPLVRKLSPQVIIPVPIHRKRMEKRGYNQALLLAKRIGKKLGIPVVQNLVMRKENTKALKELSKDQRRESLRKAFIVSKKASSYMRVLIVDDIYTTGSTVDAIAHLLKEKGVKEVYFVVICIGQGA